MRRATRDCKGYALNSPQGLRRVRSNDVTPVKEKQFLEIGSGFNPQSMCVKRRALGGGDTVRAHSLPIVTENSCQEKSIFFGLDFALSKDIPPEAASATAGDGGNQWSLTCDALFSWRKSMATTLSPQKNSTSVANRDAFSVLRKEMDDLLANFWGTTPSIWTSSHLSPAVDLSEQENAFIMKVDMPGLEAKDFNVQVYGDTVTVSGERKEEKETKDKTFYRMERSQGAFSRSVTLPCSINADEVAAEYVNGVLCLTLPKSEKSKAKKIAVKG